MMDVDVALTSAKLITLANGVSTCRVPKARSHLLNGFEVIHIFGS